MSKRHDPGGDIDRRAKVIAASRDRLAVVEADPDTDGLFFRVGYHLACRQNRLIGLVEYRHHPIAGYLDDFAPVIADGTLETVNHVENERRSIAITALLIERHTVSNIGKQ